MTNKTLIILLVVLAVSMWTAAVINFCLGDVLDGISGVLMAASDLLMARAVWIVRRVGRVSFLSGAAIVNLRKALKEGIEVDVVRVDDDPKLTPEQGEEGAQKAE